MAPTLPLQGRVKQTERRAMSTPFVDERFRRMM